MKLVGNWNYPTTIRFGAGRITELGQTCLDMGMKAPLLVTDPGLAALPMIASVMEHCHADGLGIGIFSNSKANPIEANVTDGVDAYRARGHDGGNALGGGSGLDAGKAIALMVGQDRALWDFEDVDDWWTRANADAIARIIAVPTTAGTGSEVGRASVITKEDSHEKKIIFHPRMMPS